MKSCMIPYFPLFASLLRSIEIRDMLIASSSTKWETLCCQACACLCQLTFGNSFHIILQVLHIHVMLMMMLLYYSTIAFRNPRLHRHIAKPPPGAVFPKKVCRLILYLHRSQGQLNLYSHKICWM